MQPEFIYQDMFPIGEDTTEYRVLTKKHVSIGMFEDSEIVKIDPESLKIRIISLQLGVHLVIGLFMGFFYTLF